MGVGTVWRPRASRECTTLCIACVSVWRGRCGRCNCRGGQLACVAGARSCTVPACDARCKHAFMGVCTSWRGHTLITLSVLSSSLPSPPQSTGGLAALFLAKSTESTAIHQSTSPPRTGVHQSTESTGVHTGVHRVDGGLFTPQQQLRAAIDGSSPVGVTAHAVSHQTPVHVHPQGTAQHGRGPVECWDTTAARQATSPTI